MQSDNFSRPRSLRSADAINAKNALLNEPHVEQLTKYVEELKIRHPGWEFPYFDPHDGGQDADILFLLEKPGPKTSPGRGGSGFISRDNNDATAEAIFNFMNVAGIPRKRTVLWNTIPGWNGTIKLTSAEKKEGLSELVNLLALLPNLSTIVLVGRKAEKAIPMIEMKPVKIIVSAHPSPKVRAINRAVWDSIPGHWLEAL
ncbi:uracil-DNA glycosylase [Serratia rhizosphaerae]|uniref:Uracil-DNA glycosylase n=1 Tax=Serratia rhizosphaerae TaxID=2597702 RepID=A0ABX6GKM5_9GAMM|nr:uracil-DNA glycosylase [Serratia rhizosphaerae]QHA86806.1 uracil-DNA glycosylase [Serratia rhizosphaerae]